ncbi:hypothetical protein Salpa_0377 [Sporomusa sp. KB1]|jgi:hypothetical protein|nr:hypothetical protein Salpa_0377 [Sporomusa sp. KB1]
MKKKITLINFKKYRQEDQNSSYMRKSMIDALHPS